MPSPPDNGTHAETHAQHLPRGLRPARLDPAPLPVPARPPLPTTAGTRQRRARPARERPRDGAPGRGARTPATLGRNAPRQRSGSAATGSTQSHGDPTWARVWTAVSPSTAPNSPCAPDDRGKRPRRGLGILPSATVPADRHVSQKPGSPEPGVREDLARAEATPTADRVRKGAPAETSRYLSRGWGVM